MTITFFSGKAALVGRTGADRNRAVFDWATWVVVAGDLALIGCRDVADIGPDVLVRTTR